MTVHIISAEVIVVLVANETDLMIQDTVAAAQQNGGCGFARAAFDKDRARLIFIGTAEEVCTTIMYLCARDDVDYMSIKID